MAGQDLTNFDAVLKEDYGPKIQSTINQDRILMARFERSTDMSDFQGRRAVVPINMRPSQSVGARADGGSTPSPQRQTYVDMLVPMVYNYGTVKFTLPTIKATASDRGSFARVMDAEMNGIRRDLMNDMNRQMWGDGFGALGRANGAGAATSALVLDAGHKVKRNQIIDIFTAKSGGTQEVNSVQVNSVSGTTATLENVATWSDNSWVFREDSRGNEMMGVQGIVDTTTFVTTLHGIDRSSFTEFGGQILDNPLGTGGTLRAVTLDLLQQGFLQSEELGEGEISLGGTTYNLWRKIGNLMVPDRRYTPAMTLSGGFTALDFNGKPIVADRDCPANNFFWFDESTFTIYVLADWQFDDTDGNVLHKADREAAYEALLLYYAEMACHDPANNVNIRDLSET
jgi:hypothetical protein